MATSAFPGILSMANPLVRLRKRRLSKLRHKESCREWCVNGLEINRSLVQEVLTRCECGLPDTTRQALQDWWDVAHGLVATGKNGHVDGCRILLEMHERGFVGAEEAGMVSDLGAVLAPDVKAAAKFLAEELEELAVTDVSSPSGGGAALPDQPPKKYLFNWREILGALEMDNTKENRNRISRVNKECEGPIISVGQGSPPKVERAELIRWWDHLELLWQDQANQQQGRTLEAEAQHDHGREGVAAPEIRGGVKQRRKDRKT